MVDGTSCLWAECGRTDIWARGLCKRCHMRARRAGRLGEFVAQPLTCKRCGAEYPNGTRSGFDYCSVNCREAARADKAAHDRAEALAERVCSHCGGRVPLSARKDAGYCSVACQQGAWYRENEDRLRAAAVQWNRAHPELKREQSRRWYEQNRERAAETSRRWRAENVELVRIISRQNAHRRRARKAGGLVEQFDLLEIWERDEGRCWLCETAINPRLAHPDPMSQSLDHVTPHRQGRRSHG